MGEIDAPDLLINNSAKPEVSRAIKTPTMRKQYSRAMEKFVQGQGILGERQIALILVAWHSHRVPILFLTIVLLSALRFVLRRRPSRPKASSTPPPSFQNEKLVWTEKGLQPWIEDTKQQSSSFENGDQQLRAETKTAQRRTGNSTVPKRIAGSKAVRDTTPDVPTQRQIQPLVFFSSLAGSTEIRARKFAEEVRESLAKQTSTVLNPEVYDLSYIDYDEYFTAPPKQTTSQSNLRYFYLILIPTYNIDTVLNTFLDHLKETHHDFRIDTAPLSSAAGYSVFGFGDKEGWKTEEEGFCAQAVLVDQWLARLTGKKRAFPLGIGDIKSDASERLDEWRQGITNLLLEITSNGDLGEGVSGSGDPVESGEEDADEADLEAQVNTGRPPVKRKAKGISSVGDLEDLGDQSSSNSGSFSRLPGSHGPPTIDFTTVGKTAPTTADSKEMVPASSPTHAALTKQGYAIIGSHSGVKICRWTKSALRGRGSCYKYSFYGIKSHLCMETTPSLSCSNKCVFCWRHGTNPVGTTWRWKVDPPEMIFLGAKEAHLKKIKMMRGVPGVRAERFQEAMKIRHCALSLVGEPIFYPHINEFLRLLHQDRISSFLVCNAQHPEQLEALKVVTQLYVSIDASNKESLRKVDRPLHRDFWERFVKCLDIIREKRFRMRTVYRLTLVKGFNIDDEAEGYADLVARGLPCFVEVKGVTYCGTSASAGAGLTMQNVPFYEEIIAFVEALNAALERRGLDYGIAAEHAHSCCILLASKRFLIDGKWHTIIDYEKFFECLDSGKDFAPEDYVGPPTPEWANWGNGGFDPADERVDRKGRPKGQ